MDIKTFYDALGKVCREHGARTLACDDCPASSFCYTAPASVTEALVSGIIKAIQCERTGNERKERT